MKLSGEREYAKKNFKSPRLLLVILVLESRGLHYLLDLTRTSRPQYGRRRIGKRERRTLGTKVEPHSIVGSRHTDVLQSEAWCDSRATRELKG